MALVNVNRSNPDVFYRYKMPKLIAKVEGKGNGIKTVICNMTDVGKALYRPPTYPTKFFGCELGAQTQFDLKRDRYIVNGSHEAERLQDLLDIFIKKFVLCPECENPETVFNVHAKAQTISQSCQACGYNGKLDMRHKLTTFILRNPPDGPQEGGAKKKSKKGESIGGDGDDESPDENGGPNDNQQSQDGEGGGGNDSILTKGYDDDDAVDWGEDTSEEAQQKRMAELTAAAAGLAVTADLEKTPQERADLLYEFVKTKKAESGDGKLAPCYRAILAEAERLEMKDKAILILAEVLLSADILKELKEHRTLFLSFTNGNDKAQKYLLGAFEKLVGIEFRDQLIGKTALILKAMYDLDLVDEETFLDWGKKVSKKYVNKEIGQEIHSKAEPFIKWLREAEEEESDSDADEEAVEVAFTHAEKVGLQDIKPVSNGNSTTNSGNPAKADEEDEDEIDLDDI